MQLNEIKTPFDTRKFIMVGSDGHSAVIHNKKVQLVSGNIYRGEDETRSGRSWTTCDLYVLYPESEIGLFATEADTDQSVEGYIRGFETNGLTDCASFLKMIQNKIDNDMFIGVHYIKFLEYVAPELVTSAWETRKRYGERKAREYAEKRAAEEKARQEREAAEAAARAEQDAKDRAHFDGWADDMTALKFGKVFASMSGMIRLDGKVMYNYDMIKYLINTGHKPFMEENVWHWKRNGEKSKPKTEYRMQCPDDASASYQINKTEYEFACYLYEKKQAIANKGGQNNGL